MKATATPFRTLSKFLTLLAMSGALLSLSACTPASRDTVVTLPSGEKLRLKSDETLRINLTSEPPTVDWHKATDTTSGLVDTNIMEGLVEYDLKDPELGLKPALATHWEASDLARKWKFTIRGGVKWSDGVPFTAQHVIDGWKRLLSKETASEYSYFLFPIKNAHAFNEGKVPWSEVGVRLTTPNEVSVELEKPMGYFPSLLTHQSTFPVRLDVTSKYGDAWTSPENIVTLGAYRLKAWMHDKMIVFERNDQYYGEKAKIKNIVAYMIQEQSTAINLFEAGRLDSVHSLPSTELRVLSKRKEFAQFPVLSLYYYGTNVKKPPMDDVRVRRAVAMAIDRKELVKMLGGGETPLTSWIPKGMFGYEPDIGLKFDPAKARELIKAVMKDKGYTDLSQFPRLEIKFNTNEDHQRIGENIQAQLKRNLGIGVELKNEEWKVFLKTLKTDPPQLFRFGWLADYPDPDNFMQVLTSYSENNNTRWKNKNYDDLVLKAAGLIDKEERRKMYAQAEAILVEEDVPAIPLYSSVSHLLVSERVENYPMSSMSQYIYKAVRLRSATP
jgi:oligopeptide transport system substrate-binding protein